jgi:cytochrome bd-type quinol oxidase subunit 1
MFSNLLAARAQMGTSLVFHVIFSVLGVGLPLLLCLAEGLALWRKDGTWLALSRQWTKAFAVLFAIGAVSGAVVEFEIALLWSGLVKDAGAIIGLPFALEGFAFFNRRNLSRRLSLWSQASLAARTLAHIHPHRYQWSVLRLVYHQRELLDEFS